MKELLKQLKTNRVIMCKRGVSNVITTIILTGILLTILVVATFVSTNILNAQMVSTEFEQAQSNMLLLDSTIQDVALRPGAGGYVQFNERQGGIGIATTTDSVTISCTDGTTTQTIPSSPFTSLLQLLYTGSSQASAAVDPSTGYNSLKGSPDPTVTLTQGLGFLRLAQDNGAKIKLDYNRVRIVSTGLIDEQTNMVQITFIHLVKGVINAASGTVNVMVQNIQTTPTTLTFDGGSIEITVENSSSPPQTLTVTSTAQNTVVVFSEIQIRVSIT
jgi:hypothetical protein